MATFQETMHWLDIGQSPSSTPQARKVAPGGDLVVGSGRGSSGACFRLGLGDDSVTPAITLPFPVLHPGGITNQIVVGANDRDLRRKAL